ncbi:MAG: response regulator [Bacteroidota bacterium]|nr:response regulator [Bacteroidota bacterium]
MKHTTILFVDDDADIRRAVSDGLTEKGYKVITADGGLTALNLLETIIPNLIITDLRMEPMNGFDFYQTVKNNKKFQDIPCFFLTAISDPLAEKYSHDLGVDSYLIKPIDLDELDLVIRTKLKI